MARPSKRLSCCAVAAIVLALPARAESIACHLSYGGESRIVEAGPTSSPYTVAPVAIGSYFLFRIVFRPEPAALAGIKLYTYAALDSGPVLIHQASYPYSPSAGAAPAVNGFTGRNFVYEPVRDGELQYWCEVKTGATK